jgi:hypothetical protein
MERRATVMGHVSRGPDRIALELISFFALDPEEQRSMLGPTEDWFTPEDPEINPGANYLLGMVRAFPTNKNILVDLADLPERSAVFELGFLLELLVFDRDRYYWTAKALDGPAWGLIRRLARTVLSEAGFACTPPAVPFWFPDLIEMDFQRIERPKHL